MRKKRILIVDDEESLSRAIKLNLEDTGEYEVRTESRGANALGIVHDFRPDLVILDVIMPDMDGADVEKIFEKDEIAKKVPIIFLTAIATKDDTKDRGALIGGRFVIAKPISIDRLIESIEERLGTNWNI
jgi:DNA-binding response OmpR family regulator